uniref:ABC transporter domain-containing protein n=1 Tax=Canis lupus familiaris TaxID=9615 RepID=A0A8C0SFT8_CANLF
MNLLWLNQFAVLLWKNFKRKVISLIVEIFMTLFFSGLILLHRRDVKKEFQNVTIYRSLFVLFPPPFLYNRSVVYEVAYVPSHSDVAKNITETVIMKLRLNISGFSSEAEFEKYVEFEKKPEVRVLAAIVFDHDFKNRHDSLPLKVRKFYLKLYMLALQSFVNGWNTHLLFPNTPSLGPRNPFEDDGGSPRYIREGFLIFQYAVDQAIMMYHNGRRIETIFGDFFIRIRRFPYPAYYKDDFLWLFLRPLKLVFQYSDPSLVFVFFLCFVVSSISFGFLISTLFNTATLAVSFGGFFYFVTFFLYVFVSTAYEYMTLTEKLAFCLCSNVAVALGIDFICRMEMKQYGVQWDNILSPVNPHDSLIFAHIMGMLLFDAFLYGLMTWYIDAVFPGKYGVPKPWYFFVQKSYWFNKALSIKKEERQITDMIKSDYFEDEPVDLVVGIRIQNLYKEFTTERDTILAVKNLSFNVYEGQITVLLGPNGAGKTTTMSILTGLTLPTSGKVYINGYDISKDMNHVRNNLGFCPQDDILFAELTVSEHLYFYCVIKGVPPEIRPTEVNKMLTSFGLLEKHDAIAKSLSGGMKRKLSIIIALIGGSKVVILDEPTSGMDPVSRRFTWNVLQQYKHDRTILLTTHHMDEADVLGDRIAIMVKGSLCCCGSSIFLKRIYGVGYHIIIVKEPHCDVEQITRLVEQHVPDARLETNVAAELSFILPKKHTDRFTGLLTDLEKSQEKLGIGSFGVSITTMEEVFLKKLTGAQVALNLFFGMSIFVSSFCLLTVTERITKAKHIQFVSGVSATNFWLSALLWDFLIFFIACCLLMMVFLLSGLDALTKNYRFLDTLFIFMLFGWAVIPFTYLISFLFSSHTSAYIKLVMFQYCAGVFSVILNVIVTEISGEDITPFTPFYLEDDAIGRYLIAMAVTGFIFFLLIFLLETTSWKVRTFVYRYIFFEIYKKFNKIYFTYPAVLAVRNISLGIQKKECFGLLGLNGAGKTTTFEILTGEETATSGDVFIENLSITNNLLEVRSKIGYCPQFDALLDYMTARELMVMYARLWGVPETQITQYVNKLLQSLNLEPYADKFIYTYSGGNKRRLSNAIALMGKPSVIFLDEPSTGMDPEARRLLWNRVTRARESDKVIIITSHSMEECDALCTRLAIMVKGKIMCLGSPQHLKNKFGNVYTLKAKFKIDTDEKTLEDFKKYIATVFPGSELKHENQGILNYYIPSKDNGWGKVFGILEEANKKFHLEDYSISQITLEEVFMTFAKQENIEA